MSDIVEQKVYTNWTKLVLDLRTNDENSKIYRGHTNEYRTYLKKTKEISDLNANTEVIIWQLISSFDRYYQGHNYYFSSFLNQPLQDNNFRERYGKHNFIEIFYLKDCSQLERIYYLQHYGVPTSFLDFTLSPLVALFFAISSVRTANIYKIDKDENPLIHPSESYISVYEVNHKRISELLNIKYIDDKFSWLTYGNYRIRNVHFAFDISPVDKCQLNTLNENLKLQKGCFILYDNKGSNYSLDMFINSELFHRNIEKEILIKEYKLFYNDIFKRYDFDNFHNVSLYDYLDLINISGRTLFNDIQGLKYDLNFF